MRGAIGNLFGVREEIVRPAIQYHATDHFQGHQFLGNFTPRRRWHKNLAPSWALSFTIENEECSVSDELIAVSNVLLDHQMKRDAKVPPQLPAILGGFVNNACGERNSQSYRQLKMRLELLPRAS